MPPIFDPKRHPRDRRGRFTKSRTVLASAKEKRAARDITAGFRPVEVGDGRQYAARIADPGHDKVARNFALDAKAINEDLRAGHADAAGVEPMDDAMRPLPDDVVLHRTVPVDAFGGLDPQSLQGMKVRDAGFTATQLDPRDPGPGDVRMFIATPAGSRAVVNAGTGEVYLDRDSEMVVSRVERRGDGHDMYLTVLPKAGAGSGRSGSGGGPEAKVSPDRRSTAGDGTEKPAGADEFRAELMKQRVPELQAQMRERGLKPGRKRKSELVDALVADETDGGHDSGDHREAEPAAKEPASTEPASTEPAKVDVANDGPTGSADGQIRAAVDDIIRADGGTPGDWVSITRLRAQLPDLSRAEFDAAVRELNRQPGVSVESRPDRWALNQADHDAAVSIGGDPRHLIAIQQREPDRAPARGDDPASKALVAAPLGYRDGRMTGLSSRSSRAVRAYLKHGDGPINNALRSGEIPRERALQIEALDEAMADSKLTANVQVFRGVRRPQVIFGDRVQGDLTGMVWREDAYVSTSAAQKIAEEFTFDREDHNATGLIMNISVPKGTGGLELSPVTFEAELLLDRGHDFRVVKDLGVVDGARRIDVEVLPKGAP